ncbi:hypothetical protein KI387_039260 [Taxus chinensis]|uniref:Uncharacterized protein n=1 Tax=Taxus chinensis TaxID=29808 RepID=A0AA38CF46_TAXCH|nr:hypothetical protein KI387_039260 [Taxus chinensis]
MDVRAFDTDVTLFGNTDRDIGSMLKSLDETYLTENPLMFHSAALNHSEFFEKPIEWEKISGKCLDNLAVTLTSTDTKAHLDTFTLLYYCHQGIPFPFQGVEEALSIMKVCAVWISDECLKACMRYLEAIPWSFTEKIQIRDAISIIPCKVLEDLDARLVQSDTDTQDFTFAVEQSIKSVVKSIILSDEDHVDDYTHAVEDLILNNTKAETPFAIKAIYRESLLKQWKENLGYLEKKIQHSEITGLVPATRACLWLIKVIGQDRSLFTKSMEDFNNNTQLCQLLLEVKSEDGKPYSPLIVEIIIYFLKALGSAETITTKDVKLKFLENWVPVFSFLVYNVSEGTKISPPWAYSHLVIRVMATLGGKDAAELLRKWRNQPAPPLLEGNTKFTKFLKWVNLLHLAAFKEL